MDIFLSKVSSRGVGALGRVQAPTRHLISLTPPVLLETLIFEMEHEK